jgi:uncharacterized membrane protein
MTFESAPHWRIARWRPSASALTLLGSLCLNIGFAGYIAVQVPTADPRAREHVAPDAIIASFAGRLPSRDGDILWRMYLAKKPEIEAADEAAQRARLQMVSMLAQHDLDTDLLRATFKEFIESRARMQNFLADAAIEAFKQISPEGRQQLVKQGDLPAPPESMRPQILRLNPLSPP